MPDDDHRVAIAAMNASRLHRARGHREDWRANRATDIDASVEIVALRLASKRPRPIRCADRHVGEAGTSASGQGAAIRRRPGCWRRVSDAATERPAERRCHWCGMMSYSVMLSISLFIYLVATGKEAPQRVAVDRLIRRV